MIKMIICLMTIFGIVFTQTSGYHNILTSEHVSKSLKNQEDHQQVMESGPISMNQQSNPPLSLQKSREATNRRLNDEEKTKITVVLVLFLLIGLIVKKCIKKSVTTNVEGIQTTPEACLVSNNQHSPAEYQQTNPEEPPIIIVQNIQNIKQKYLITQNISIVSQSVSSYINQTAQAVSGTQSQ